MNIWKYVVALFAICWVSTASAEGFYLGGGVSFTQIEDEDSGFEFDDSATGYRLLAGYEFFEHFAVEGAYFNTGEAEDKVFGSDVDAELDGFMVSALGLLPLSDAWTLFGKLGYYDGEAEVDVQSLGSADDDEDGFTAGAGVRFNMNDQFSVRADYDWFDTDLDELWSIGLTLQYTFGH